jgi:hypothetical protein
LEVEPQAQEKGRKWVVRVVVVVPIRILLTAQLALLIKDLQEELLLA